MARASGFQSCRNPRQIGFNALGVGAQIAQPDARDGSHIDLRHKAGDPATSLLAGAVPVSADGAARILVEDADAGETSAFLVLLDVDERVIAQDTVIIGGEG